MTRNGAGIPPGADVVYYAQPRGPATDDGTRTKLGPEHPTTSFGQARRHLDQHGGYGEVERWMFTTQARELVAKRDDTGTWWDHNPVTDTWTRMAPGSIPDYPSEPQPAAARPGSGTVPAEIAEVAASMGHTVQPDPTHTLSRAERWTCTRCGNAVLRYDSNVYGTATTDRCTQPKESAG